MEGSVRLFFSTTTNGLIVVLGVRAPLMPQDALKLAGAASAFVLTPGERAVCAARVATKNTVCTCQRARWPCRPRLKRRSCGYRNSARGRINASTQDRRRRPLLWRDGSRRPGSCRPRAVDANALHADDDALPSDSLKLGSDHLWAQRLGGRE